MTEIKQGDEVQVLPMLPGKPLGDEIASGVFIVEDYVSAEDSEDGEAFYWLSNSYYMNGWATASRVALKRSAGELNSRKPPTREEIASAVELSSFKYNHEETDFSNPDSVEIIATTDEGLRFYVTLKVVSVEEEW